MEKLQEYVGQHSVMLPADQATEGVADLTFFKLGLKNDPNPMEFASLVRQHSKSDLFDGAEYNYLELGAVLGDKELALRVMGMGSLLGLWKLQTPKELLDLDPNDHVDAQVIRCIADLGYVVIQRGSE